jgi:hypothetical protein
MGTFTFQVSSQAAARLKRGTLTVLAASRILQGAKAHADVQDEGEEERDEKESGEGQEKGKGRGTEATDMMSQ